MWLLLLILIAGWWNTLDSAGSIVDGLHEIHEVQNGEWTSKDKILMAARLVRGLFGLALTISAFFILLGMES